MRMDVIRERIRDVPFVPFTVRLADGRALPVPHPDFIAVSPREVFHVSSDDGAITRVDPRLIVSLDESPQSQSSQP